MAARGPDGLGEWYSQDERVGLGHRRLTIIDLSERGAQPMTSADGKLVITFNGDIYNYRQLRASLEAAGRTFYDVPGNPCFAGWLDALGRSHRCGRGQAVFFHCRCLPQRGGFKLARKRRGAAAHCSRSTA
jgi:hypothetical protein